MQITPIIDLLDLPSDSRFVAKPDSLSWGYSAGYWGDTLVDLGTFYHYLGEGGIILFTPLSDIPQFVSNQTFIREVRHVAPKSGNDYMKYYCKGIDTPPNVDPLPVRAIIRRAGIDPKLVTCTNINHERARQRQVFHWHGAVLPPQSWNNASKLLEISGLRKQEKFKVLFPYSINSSPLKDHWEHWNWAIEWLLRYTDSHYILCGSPKDVQVVGDHPRLINLVGKSSSFMDVMALSEMSSGVVTTSSGLSHWAVIQNIPAVVVGNMPLKYTNNFFRRWLNAPNIELVEFDDPVERFVEAYTDLF